MSVLIVTSLGDIVVDLHTDLCPLTTKNFLKLCKIKYYNGCLFHTVQKDFTAQTGDPTGTGTGGDSIYKFLYGDQARFFGDEIRLELKHTKMGTVAMASAGEDLNASQFYITLRDDLDYLDGKHTVFGEIAEGHETLQRINEAYVDDKSRPYKNIRIKHTYILDDPFDDPSQLSELIPDASPEGKPKDEVENDVRLEDDWVPMDEQLGASELEEILRTKDAHSSAVVLESIGDIPDADIKPPDNVLFVCKLNPVTEDEDLHTIFSRFGTVTSAEVIRDYKTGDSLCYAFIGRFLEAKYEHLYWTPCAAHCLDLMLEDIFKIPRLKKTFERGIAVHGYIYNRPTLLNMMRRYTNLKNLIKPAKTRFATAFLTLSRMHQQKNNLRKMVTSEDWTSSKWAKEPQGKRMAQTLLMPSFWNTVVFALKVSGPLVKVLRLVDTEKKPPMGYIYEAMDRAKECIASSFDHKEEKYNEIFEIIDKRWDVQLHRPLHAAAHFLNPEFFYPKALEVQRDHEVMNGFYECMQRLVPDVTVQDLITNEMSIYMKAESLFGKAVAIRQRNTRAPGNAGSDLEKGFSQTVSNFFTALAKLNYHGCQEFETNEACEQAYFKMDNALIDDRRIHVDFSQSVSKLWSQYRRRDNQMAKGKGCFKCGAPDHNAKDCTGDPSTKQQPPKYTLKEDNNQRGGDDNSRFEMVFDEDTARRPQREKKRRDYEIEDNIEKRKVEHRSSEDLKQREYENSRDRQRHSDRSRECRDHERNRESRTSQSSGSQRDYKYHEERRDREKYTEKRGHKDDSQRHDREFKKRNEDEQEYRKRSVDNDGHKDDSQRHDWEFKKRNEDEQEYRKRSVDNDSRGSGRDDEGHKRLNVDNHRRDKRDESTNRPGDRDRHRRH